MNLSQIETIANIVESVFIAFAAVLAGAWALYQFFTLKRIDQARAEVEKLKRELKQQSVADVTMDAEIIRSSEGVFISVEVKIHNLGNRTELINLEESCLSATKVLKSTESFVNFSPEMIEGYRDPRTAREEASLLPGETQTETYLICVENPGIYYLDLEIQGSHESNEEYKKILSSVGKKMEKDERFVWYISKSIVVT
ncbi:UNVERIFIED_ORG: hypothetical protein DFO82_2243 [Idiomarina abyssalis]|uniref:hypothetical protein n=1 Tax=Idiomarina sp. 017G TaxID=2183988 RepID=UPI000E0E5253|nr:hypothetical protein [Idiomarina sp. 017G]TDO47424.1 hypothetical protein DEU30_10810 [Idiomarina sp. 017G]